MGTGIDDICAVLGLGTPGDPPELVAGGSSAARWRVRTARGRWLVKTTPAPPDWQLHEMQVSGRLERAAYEAGVPMPAPAEPVAARSVPAGYWVRLDEDGRYARASAWIDGMPCTGPASESLAAWLGRTIAAIECLRLPSDPSAEAAYPVHPMPDWQEWLGQAVSAGTLRRTGTLAVLDAITDGTALVREALAGNPEFRLAHRDVSRSNIVVAAGGPVLIDFDYAGPEVPWWEFVHHGFDLASPVLGEQPPRPELIHVALASYAGAGGLPGPARPEAFAGLVRAMLSTLAYELWLAPPLFGG